MADIRCPNCGKNNPDFLDYCQFCQTPLKPESTLRIGDKPVKKNTGELEPVLPEWLRDVRQQARDAAEEDQAQSVSMPKVQKEEPPDLLAGLAFQSQNADEEEVPDWLSRLGGASKKEKPVATPAEPASDFFAQFEKNPPAKEEPAPSEEKTPSGMSKQQAPAEDELSAWFAKASEEPAEPLPEHSDLSHVDSGWGIQNESIPFPQQPAKEEEDLSWLHNLEEESKKTGELSTPKEETDWFADAGTPAPTPPSGGEDLSWLNNLGALPRSETPAQGPGEASGDLSWLNDFDVTPEQPASRQEPKENPSWLQDFETSSTPEEAASRPQEDLSWLNSFNQDQPSPPAPTSSASKDDLSWLNNLETPASEQPAAPAQDDLSWLNNLGSTSAPEQPSTQSQDDLSWLNAFGSSPTSEPASSAADDLSWLNSFQSDASALTGKETPPAPEETPEIRHVAPFTPRKTAPLSPEDETSVPDWLRSATEGPSMPVNAEQLDQFREDIVPAGPDEPFSWKNFVPEAKMDEEPAQTKPEPAFFDSELFTPTDESAALSNQEVDSLFSEMPDWLSRPSPEESKPIAQEPQDIGIHAEGGEALSPVDLPSWVQAMRPVEAVISETPSVENQPTEREGPLAGFKGVLPAVPIGSSRRPQPIALKLQVSAEQQASAAIMEQILASETSPRELTSAPTFASQRMLRIGLAALMWVVLGAILFLRTQIIPISAVLPPDADAAAQTLQLIPDNSSVLVVMDYEPSLAGEMEATSSPLLNQLVLLRHPRLAFISTSPNGPGLVDRLLRTTEITAPSGPQYQEGQNYFNLGYLPGGEAGVLSFIQSPASMDSAVSVGGFSQYAAVILLTDHSDSARSWIEQLQTVKQADPTIANQPLLVVSSAQVGPMLQPYVSSRQVNGLINGVADAARYEFRNGIPTVMLRSYWDAFGGGVMLAVALIVLGSLWSLFMNIRAQRKEPGEA
jgi:hypothetical protein